MAISYIYGGIKGIQSAEVKSPGNRAFYLLTGPTGLAIEERGGKGIYTAILLESIMGIAALALGILAIIGVIHLPPGVGTGALIGGSIETGFAILSAAGITLGRLACS